MNIQLYKAVRGSYWWEKSGEIDIDSESIESIEQMTDRTPGGSTSNAYVRIVMKSGVEHKVYGDIHDVRKQIADQSEQ